MLQKYTFIILFIAGILITCYVAWKSPGINWDVLGYTGTIYQRESADALSIHKSTYDEARQHMDPQAFKLLTSQNEYRIRCANDAVFFSEQLPFYSVKKGYVLLLGLLNKTGFSVYESARLLSILAYILTASIILLWLSRYLSWWLSVVLSLLIMIVPPIFELAKIQTPDALSVAITMAALYLLIEVNKQRWAIALLLLSITIRPDNYLTLFVFSAWMVFQKDSQIPVVLLLVINSIAVLIYSAMSTYGWAITFYHSLIDINTPPSTLYNYFPTVPEYLTVLMNGIIYYRLKLIIGAFSIAVLLFLTRKFGTKLNENYMFGLVAMTALCTLKFMLLPMLDNRYFAAQLLYFLLLLALLLTTAITGKFFNKKKTAEKQE